MLKSILRRFHLLHEPDSCNEDPVKSARDSIIYDLRKNGTSEDFYVKLVGHYSTYYASFIIYLNLLFRRLYC